MLTREEILRILPPFENPTCFHTSFESTQHIKRSVYYIARLKQLDKQVKVIDCGTGILVKNNKLITCAHVVDDQELDKNLRRNDSDQYCLIYRNENDDEHLYCSQFKLNETLHIYHDIDLAILDLPDSFYFNDKGMFLHPNHHVKISMKPRNLGYDVGILGYPFQQISISQDIHNSININYNDIILRADKGVVNQSKIEDDKYVYEFTIPFNLGNSGGPIFDTHTGEIIAMVQGFQIYPLHTQSFESSNKQIIHTIHTRYSKAISLNTFEKQLKEHKII